MFKMRKLSKPQDLWGIEISWDWDAGTIKISQVAESSMLAEELGERESGKWMFQCVQKSMGRLVPQRMERIWQRRLPTIRGQLAAPCTSCSPHDQTLCFRCRPW
jgi:hypothetical protein